MTGDKLVYPRLSRTRAQFLWSEARSAFEGGGLTAVAALVSDSHLDAAPVPTGGRVATASDIRGCRSAVMAGIDRWYSRASLPQDSQVEFDVTLGRVLHSSLRILPADAAHDETWNFISLVVFPDVIALRFPDLAEARFLGKYPRNALRRVWLRQEILGGLLSEAEHPLGEDEATGIFERTEVARNHRLARLLAQEVMRHPSMPGGRSFWAREFYKRVRYVTGPLLLDVLDDLELAQLIQSAATEAQETRLREMGGVDASPEGSIEPWRVPFTS